MLYSVKHRSSFGQRVKGYNTRSNEGMGGGGYVLGIKWNGRFVPPKNRTTKVRLLPGSYTDLEGLDSEYYQYVEHFAKRSNRGFICSKKYKLEDGRLVVLGGECLGCDEIDNGAEDVSARLLHALNGIHLVYYHLQPAVDKQNKPILYRKGEKKGEQVLKKVECEGRGCEHCRARLEKVFGRKIHWSIGRGHLNDLGGIVEEIEKDCIGCSQGRLDLVAYECSNCAEPLIDMAHTELKDEEIESKVSRPMKCSCGNVDFPIKQVECNTCQDPLPLSVFDCDLEIKRQGEPPKSTIQIPRWNPAVLSDDLKEMAKPWPFPKIFAPDPFEWQAKVLKIKNPHENKKAENQARDYTDEADFDA